MQNINHSKLTLLLSLTQYVREENLHKVCMYMRVCMCLQHTCYSLPPYTSTLQFKVNKQKLERIKLRCYSMKLQVHKLLGESLNHDNAIGCFIKFTFKQV